LRSRQALPSALKRSRSCRLIRRIRSPWINCSFARHLVVERYPRTEGGEETRGQFLSSPKDSGFFSPGQCDVPWFFYLESRFRIKPGDQPATYTAFGLYLHACHLKRSQVQSALLIQHRNAKIQLLNHSLMTFMASLSSVTSVLPCIPSRCSRGQVQVVKRILLFGLYWNGASGRFLRTVFSMISASVTPKRIAVSDNRLANASSFMNTRILGRGILGGFSSTHLGTRCKPSAGTSLKSK
jgi:hypothetical protein